MTRSKSSTLAVPVSDVSAPESDSDLAEKNAYALVPNSGTAAQKLIALQQMLETPYVSGTAAAENEAVVTILRVAEGEIADIVNPETMVQQYLYLCALQTPIAYEDRNKQFHDHAVGDTVIIAIRKGGKPREAFAQIIAEETAAGATVPNLLVRTVPSKKGLNPYVTFRQLVGPEPIS